MYFNLLVDRVALLNVDGVANLFLNCRALLFLNGVLHSVADLRTEMMKRDDVMVQDMS